jgi:hypothetical protein
MAQQFSIAFSIDSRPTNKINKKNLIRKSLDKNDIQDS